ncbi:NfeD family protein [Polyangium aurulentum]|uniref:NfeD family protein n=1 Tax=Polyangium aurulentum TaxID=2567896 RepID=UPI0010AE24EE|nr:NfeD family protein [Polyangium aurulentum]UQA55215.1 NfeD family protein [Polyangium aurulentum]
MGLVYLFALVASLGILIVQFAMGGKGDADGELHAGDAHPGGDAHGADAVHAGKPVAKALPTAPNNFIAFFLSFRFWIFALLGFGLSGTLLHFLSLAGTVTAALVAAFAGLSSGLFATWAIRVAMRSSFTSSDDVTQARGRTGRVLVPCARGKVGQVRIEIKGQSVDLLATTEEDEISRGEHVLVVDFDGQVARVARRPPELA